MRILLTSTPWEKHVLVRCDMDDDVAFYPIGIAYLHSYLESKGHEVRTLWLNNHSQTWMQQLKQEIQDFNPNIVGFNVLSANRLTTYQGIEYIHSVHPGIQIVIGASHATAMYDQLLRKYPYIIVVRGEGESTFADIAAGKPVEEIDGIAYYDSALLGVVKNTDRVQEDLDALPFPKHELFFKGKRNMAHIFTSRGCTGNCSFCVLNPITKRRVRFRSIENVMAEIEFLVASFPQMTQIWINDDSFFINPPRVIEFCNEIIRRGIKKDFICIARAKPVTPEMVKKLEEAGFTDVQIGLESGDPEILKRCHKGITPDDVERAITLFADSKVTVGLFLITGLPGETWETNETTGKFLQKIQKIKYVYIPISGIPILYPGTELYEDVKAAGLLTDDIWLTDAPTPIYTKEHSLEELLKMREALMNVACANQFKTVEGFRKQWYMAPWIFPWWVKMRWNMLKERKS
jgi:anaerobic magnesium-protoporphyrin IX monomethyl ester cyclase